VFLFGSIIFLWIGPCSPQLISDLQLRLSDEEIGEWQQYTDADASGSVKWSEFEPVAAELIAKYYSTHEFEDQWREHTDTEGNVYRVNLSDGKSEWIKRAEKPMSPHIKHMWLLFKKHDSDDSGELDWSEFWSVLTELGLEMTDDEIGKWQSYADADGNGSIIWSEFEPMAEEVRNGYSLTSKHPECIKVSTILANHTFHCPVFSDHRQVL